MGHDASWAGFASQVSEQGSEGGVEASDALTESAILRAQGLEARRSCRNVPVGGQDRGQADTDVLLLAALELRVRIGGSEKLLPMHFPGASERRDSCLHLFIRLEKALEYDSIPILQLNNSIRHASAQEPTQGVAGGQASHDGAEG